MRKENWEEILTKEINKALDIEFKYGKNDCTIWSTDVIKKYTDLQWSATWKNKREAIKYQKSCKMQEEVSKVLGPPLNNISFTQRGDLVQKGEGMDAALGICIGSSVVFLQEKKGIREFKLTDCTYSWRI